MNDNMSSNMQPFINGDFIVGNKQLRDQISIQQNFDSTRITTSELKLVVNDLQVLLNRLSSESNSNSAVIGAKAIQELDTNKSLKERSISAVKAVGYTAIEKMIDHPAISILMEGIKGFVE